MKADFCALLQEYVGEVSTHVSFSAALLRKQSGSACPSPKICHQSSCSVLCVCFVNKLSLQLSFLNMHCCQGNKVGTTAFTQAVMDCDQVTALLSLTIEL